MKRGGTEIEQNNWRDTAGGRVVKSRVKSPDSRWELPLKRAKWGVGEVGGIPGVGVKYVDIWRNISGEGDYLANN